MNFLRYFSVLVFVAAIGVSQIAKAEIFTRDAEEDSRIAAKIYPLLTPEEQEILVMEAEKVYQFCIKEELFANFHDCQCLSARFFDVRIQNPDLNMDIINLASQFSHDCPNVPGAAGYAYNQCMTSYSPYMAYGAEAFCECYATKFGTYFEKNTNANISNLNGIGTAAILECNDEVDGPSPINPAY